MTKGLPLSLSSLRVIKTANQTAKAFFKLIFLLLFFGAAIQLNAQQGNKVAEFAPNRVIVKFNAGLSASVKAAFKANLEKELKSTKTRKLSFIDAEVWEFSKGNVQDVIAKWKNDPRIKYIEPDYIIHASINPNDPQLASLWGMTKIQADLAWNTTTGTNVIVGVIDSGVDYLHPDLAANMWTNPGEIPGNGVDDDNNGYIDDVHGYDFKNNDGDPMDDLFHGTHVAGTIAAVGNNGVGVVGVNWTARIMALKFIGSNNSGLTSDAVRAVQYATQMGAQLTNNSWGGGGYSQALYDAIQAAGAANKLFVASAGNDNLNNDVYLEYPASYDLDNIIAVAATDENDLRASFSNYGATTVDLGAPGVNILSTYPTNHASGPYHSINGTSMASPHVAGVAALILSMRPELSFDDVKAIILNSVDPVASLAGKTVTGGRLNAYKAITLSQTWTPLLPPVITVSPNTITVSIDPDASTTQQLLITNNTGSKNLRWTITAPACTWVTLNRTSGTTVAGGSEPVQVTVNATALAPGTYQCSFTINSNDINNPQVQVVVNLTVNYQPPPVALVSPGSFDFSLTTGRSTSNVLTIKNNAATGSRKLRWNASVQGSNTGWLKLSATSGIADAQNNNVLQVAASAIALAGGFYQASISITTDDPDNPSFQLPVTLTVTQPIVRGQKLYWINGGTINRSNLDGSNAYTVQTGLRAPLDLAVDEGERKLYWVDLQDNAIYRCDLDGVNKQAIIGGLSEPYSIALDTVHNQIYWIDVYPDRRIRRVNYDGTGLVTLINLTGQNNNGLSLDVAGGKMYWAEGFGNTGIWRANLDGSSRQKIIDPPSGPYGAGDPFGLDLDLVHGKLYWGEVYPGEAVHQANLDGSGDQIAVAGFASNPNGIAVDPVAGKLYCGDENTVVISRSNFNGTGIESLNLSGRYITLDLSPICPPANIVYVNANAAGANDGTSWTDAFTRLQDALALTNSCSNISQIWVAAGTYYPDQGGGKASNDRNASFSMKNGIAIYGGFPNSGNPVMTDRNWLVNVTILSGDLNSDDGANFANNGDNSYHVFVNNGLNSTAILDGFTISSGNDNSGVANSGGGGMLNTSSNITLNNCIFSGNSTTIAGGAIHNHFSSAAFTNCHFTANKGTQAGAVYNFAGSASVFADCSFTGNVSSNSFAALTNFLSGVTVTNCSFTGNSGGNGGAMYNQGSGPYNVNNCHFTSNTAPSGGAIYNFDGILNLNSSDFSGNTATGAGGAIITLSRINAINCVFIGNTTGTSGGAISSADAVNSTNCSFSGNSAPSAGTMGVNCCSSIKNTIVWGNSSGITFANPSGNSITNSILQGGCPANITCNNVQDVNPMFVNQPPVGTGIAGDLHLQSSSPAINAGTNAGAPSTDIEGNPRPLTVANPADIGAYEVQCTAPVFSACPSNQTANALSNVCSNIVTYTATATGLPDPTITYEFSGATTGAGSGMGSGSSFNVGVTTVTLTATNGCANAATCSFTVTVTDVTAPTITCPSNLTFDNSPNQCGRTVTYAATANDNCTGSPTISYSIPPGSLFQVGTTTVTVTAKDASNNTTTCNFTVTIVDAQNPTITCPANITVNNDLHQCGAVVSFAATAQDNCSGTTISYSSAPGSLFTIGTTTVTAEAKDVAGNTATCSFTVTVTDNEAPQIICPAAIVSVNTEPNVCSAHVTYNVSTSDNCPGQLLTQTAGLPSGSVFPLGSTINSFKVTDVAGNLSTCSFTVIVVDNQAPVVPTVLPVTAQCSATPAIPTAQDNCAGTITGTTTTPFPITAQGTTAVTWKFDDGRGNVSTTTQNVIIHDVMPPVITCPANITVNNDPNQCGAIVNFAATASDNCTGVVVSYSRAPGSLFPIGSTIVTATARDVAGNTATCQFTVKVTDIQNPIINCPGNITVNASAGQCGAIVNFAVTASDNCPGTTITYSRAPGSFFATGITVVIVTAKDAGGRTATCAFAVVMLDAQAPVISCPANITQTVSSGCSKKITLPNPTVNDNCGLAIVNWYMTGATTDNSSLTGINYAGSKTFNTGITTVTYTAIDIYGNISRCSFTVKLTETVPPNITCPSGKTVSTDNGYCYAHVNLGTPSVSDNCGIASVTNNAPATFPIGTTVVTWKVTDNSGNSKTCTQSIIVEDKQNPTVTTPANINQNAGSACITSVVTPNPTYFDNCTIARLTWVMTGSTTGNSPTTGINFVGTKNFNAGTTTITYTVKDASGNSSSSSFTVKITDVAKPSLSCPANITQTASSGSCSKSIAVADPTYSDNCGISKLLYTMQGATVSSSSSSGINKVGTKTFNVGVTSVTYTALDISGNSQTCTFTVTVTDNQNPVATCPPAQTFCKVNSNNYNIPLLNRSDNCGIATTTWQITGATNRSGSGTNASGTFNLGQSTITWTVKDVNGNTTVCTTLVKVLAASNCNLTRTGVTPDVDIKSPDSKEIKNAKLELSAGNQLEVEAYPNPTEYYYNVKIKSPNKETVEIRIYDMLGKLVEQKRGAANQTYRFGDHVVSGMYMVVVTQGGETATIKVVKQ